MQAIVLVCVRACVREERSACPQQLRNVYMRGDEAELTNQHIFQKKIVCFCTPKKWASACDAEQAPVVVCMRVCLCMHMHARALLLSLSCAPAFMLDMARMPRAHPVEGALWASPAPEYLSLHSRKGGESNIHFFSLCQIHPLNAAQLLPLLS